MSTTYRYGDDEEFIPNSPEAFHPQQGRKTKRRNDDSPISQGGSKKKQKTMSNACPFACTGSDGEIRSFSCNFNLKQHIREKHTDERPFKCQLCGPDHRGFNRAYCLNRHMENNHEMKIGPGRGNAPRRNRSEGTGSDEKMTGSEQDDQDNSDFNHSPDFASTPSGEEVESMTGVQQNGQPAFAYTTDQAQMPTYSTDEEAGAQQNPDLLPGMLDLNNYGTPELNDSRYFEHDNHAFEAIDCAECGELFVDRDSVLGHLHIIHGFEMTPYCSCEVCSSVYRNGASAPQHDKVNGFAVDPPLAQPQLESQGEWRTSGLSGERNAQGTGEMHGDIAEPQLHAGDEDEIMDDEGSSSHDGQGQVQDHHNYYTTSTSHDCEAEIFADGADFDPNAQANWESLLDVDNISEY